MANLSTALYQSVNDADNAKRRMWVWIWVQLLQSCPKHELRKMLKSVEEISLEVIEQQVLLELAFKAEAIELLLEA